MNEKFYLLGGTLIILIGILMPIKAVRQMLSGVTNFVIVTLIDLSVIALIGAIGYFLFYRSGVWAYGFVISNALVKETFDSQTENLAKLAAVGVPIVVFLFTMILLSIRKTTLFHPTLSGHVSSLCIGQQAIVCGLEGYILWPWVVVQIPKVIFTISLPRTIAQDAARSSNSDPRLVEEGKGFSAITQLTIESNGVLLQSVANVLVKVRITMRLHDARKAVEFLKLGRRTEIIDLDSSSSTYREELERDTVVAAALEAIRKHLAECDLLKDVYGMRKITDNDRKTLTEGNVNMGRFLPHGTYQGILDKINLGQVEGSDGSKRYSGGAKAAGFEAINLNIEKVIPDTATLDVMTAGQREMTEGSREEMDQSTAEKLLPKVLKQFRMTEAEYLALPFEQRLQLLRQVQVVQAKMTAGEAARYDVQTRALGALDGFLALGTSMLKQWLGNRLVEANPAAIQPAEADPPKQQDKPQSGPKQNWPKKQTPPPAIVEKPKAEGDQPTVANPSPQRNRFLSHHPDNLRDRPKPNT